MRDALTATEHETVDRITKVTLSLRKSSVQKKRLEAEVAQREKFVNNFFH